MLADLWKLTAQIAIGKDAEAPDHPVRAEMESRKQEAAKATRRAEIQDRFQKLKNKYRKRT